MKKYAIGLAALLALASLTACEKKEQTPASSTPAPAAGAPAAPAGSSGATAPTGSAMPGDSVGSMEPTTAPTTPAAPEKK